MTLRQWLVLIGAAALIIVLYNLPRVVVDNDAQVDELTDQSSEMESKHSFELAPEDVERIRSLQNLLEESQNNKKNAIFADSLAGIFMSYNKLDSAGVYANMILELDSSIENQLRAGEMYFQLYGISLNQNNAKEFADKAGDCFSKVLKTDENPDIRAKLAMTKVVTSNPMAGIVMLRGVLEEHPDNKTALYSMGVLSMQSGQYDKAVERFEKLMTVDGSNSQAAYYLGVSYYEIGDLANSREWFEKIERVSTDPAILESTGQYLKKLNEL